MNNRRRFVVFKDGSRRELSPMTFEEYEENLWRSGSNDTSYDSFLYYNNYEELDRLNDDALLGCTVEWESDDKDDPSDFVKKSEVFYVNIPEKCYNEHGFVEVEFYWANEFRYAHRYYGKFFIQTNGVVVIGDPKSDNHITRVTNAEFRKQQDNLGRVHASHMHYLLGDCCVNVRYCDELGGGIPYNEKSAEEIFFDYFPRADGSIMVDSCHPLHMLSFAINIDNLMYSDSDIDKMRNRRLEDIAKDDGIKINRSK